MISLLVLALAVLGARAEPQDSNCGKSSVEPHPFPRIVGGVEAKKHSWPWMGSLRRVSIFGVTHSCGCSLISDKWVLTAAHCVEGNSNPNSYRVDVGRHHRDYVTEGTEQLLSLNRVIWHEHFDEDDDLDNDVAVLELKTPAQLNNQVGTVCLPTLDVPAVGTNCTITGWGNVQGTCCSNLLKQALVPYVDMDTCRRPDYYGNSITDNMVCAGFERGGTDTCQGDSGGPLQLKKANGAYQVNGLTSWGAGCAQAKKPGVYTRVFNYLNWIQQKTGLTPPTF